MKKKKKQIQIIAAPDRLVRHHRTMKPLSSDKPTKVPATAYYRRALLAEDAILANPKKSRRPPKASKAGKE